VYVYHSVRRYKSEGVGSLVQKQFKSGFIYLFTGRAYDTENYEFGTFSRYAREERDGRRAEPDGKEVKKLLDTFDRQSRRLRHQIEKFEGENGQKPSPAKGAAKSGSTRKRRPDRTRRRPG
jgi:hypothetical protein